MGDDTMLLPALNFNGEAEQAIDFYANIFGYRIRDGDMDQWSDGSVVYAEIIVYGSRLIIADVEDDDDHFAGFTLSIYLTDEDELRRVYAALSDGGEIIMLPQRTLWSHCYGMLKDKFGITWQFELE